LTSLRFFAAASVFVYHLDLWDVVLIPGDLASSGYTGVGLFFLLSGFVLSWGTRPGLPARVFYRRRFARIWPSHAVMLVCSIAVPVVAVQRDLASAVPNLFLVQAWYVRDQDVVYGMNGVSWSLSCEAFFYATFPVAVLVVGRIPRVAAWLAAAGGLSLSLILALEWPSMAYHLPVSRYGEFLLGLVAGVAVRDGWRPRVPGLAVATSLVLGATVGWVLPFPLPGVVMAVPFLLLILQLALRDLEQHRGWLQSRCFVFAGEVSFAFYLVHELLIVNLREHVPAGVLPALLVITPLALLAAVTLHLLVERPMNRLLRDRAPSLALAPPRSSVLPTPARRADGK
jgi:peptidoglycan/LPS O-acetylase OafA/YrhL